ncbi:hypothetical protein U337_02547 [Staphylococcus aureus W48969]|uniref:recombinase RecT n=1 Tax=Staphylococcus aureus TaxID=1280 RepID=UPI0004511B86|nr:recombinase RecT [Staphylococcus aureus]EWU65211.1 hypothetical protein U337_02547 [Staphylococcus aureus W48969]
MTDDFLLQTIELGFVVVSSVSAFVLHGVLVFASHCSFEFAIDSSLFHVLELAWFQIGGYNPLLGFAASSSVAAFLVVVVVGFFPAANHCCFFLLCGDMVLFRSCYGGVMVLTRGVGGADVVAAVVFFGGAFVQYMGETGRIVALEHAQSFFNIDTENIIGAYCTVVFNDGRGNYIEVMTFEEIEEAWMQSSMVYDGVFLEDCTPRSFFQEVVAKTVVIRGCAKLFISTSAASLFFNYVQESEQRQRKEVLDAEVEENANQEQLDFEQPVLEEAQYTELENDKPIDVSDFEEIKEPATEKESEEEPF